MKKIFFGLCVTLLLVVFFDVVSIKAASISAIDTKIKQRVFADGVSAGLK